MALSETVEKVTEDPSPKKEDEEVVTKFFFYGTLRDDDHTGAAWTSYRDKKLIVDDQCKAQTARVKGFKILKRRDFFYPFAVRTDNEEDFVIGRLIWWECDTPEETAKLAALKTQDCDIVEGYRPTQEQYSLFRRQIVEVEVMPDEGGKKDEDSGAEASAESVMDGGDAESKKEDGDLESKVASIETTKAVMYYQTKESISEMDLRMQVIYEVPGSDWLNWDSSKRDIEVLTPVTEL